MRSQLDNASHIVYSSVLAVLNDEYNNVRNRIEENDFGPAQFAYESGRAAELENLIKVFEKRRNQL